MVSLHNVLLANNGSGSLNAGGGFASLGHNLSDNSPGALSHGTDQVGATVALGVLANNGGPTRTHALLAGSDAIDAGDTAAAPTTDQLNMARAGTADIGAVGVPGRAQRRPREHRPDHTDRAGGHGHRRERPVGVRPQRHRWRPGLAAVAGQPGRHARHAERHAARRRHPERRRPRQHKPHDQRHQADINATLATLQYQGLPQASGSDTLTLTSRDDGGLTDTDSIAITITPVNDAPVLTDTLLNRAVDEDSDNLFFVSDYTGGVGDADAGALQGMAITALDQSHGQWFYSTMAVPRAP